MRSFIGRYGTALAGVALIAFFWIFARHFSDFGNLLNIAKDASFLAILSIGFMLALRVAELDLSVADVASLCAVIAGALIHHQFATWQAVLAALAAGCMFGLANGFGVTVLKVPSLIVTLGTAAIAKGLAFAITQGVSFTGQWPTSFTGIARGSLMGLSNLLWIFALVALATWWLLHWTRTGAHMIATGEAEDAARLAGIHTNRAKRLGLALAGALAGLTSVLLAANVSSAAPNMAGDYFLYLVAAVLLGMTMFDPGKPNIIGTTFAAVVLKVLGNGLVLMGAAYYVQDVLLGLIIIGSVAFSASVLRRAAFRV